MCVVACRVRLADNEPFELENVMNATIRCLLVTCVLSSIASAKDKVNRIDGVTVTGEDNPDLQPLDKMMVTIMRDHEAPGATLAVSRKGKLVYARGFGVANARKTIPVFPSTKFRIASVSKPITSAAVASLVHDGKLQFDDPIGKFFNRAERRMVNPQILKITIRQLLQHRGGWDEGITYDPFMNTALIGRELELNRPANQQEVISFVLRRPLAFEPGSKHVYCNFGFILAGRIIERVSNQSYEKYVQKKVFERLKIRSTVLGRTLVQTRGETQYFDRKQELVDGVVPGVTGKKVPPQYGGWIHEYLDAAGGWIATASDLVKFADGLNSDSDFLSNEVFAELFKPASQDQDEKVYYAMGWNVRTYKNSDRTYSWHAGDLPGTSSFLGRRRDGINVALIFNVTDGKDGKHMVEHCVIPLHKAIDRVSQWPETELTLKK